MNNQLGMEMSIYIEREQEGESPSTQERRTYNTEKEKTKCRTKRKHTVRERCHPQPNKLLFNCIRSRNFDPDPCLPHSFA